MQAQFGNALDTSDTQYRTIYTNFMNQRWGFSLSYEDYQNYKQKLTAQPSAILCNTPVFSTVSPDPYACIEAQIGTAVLNGRRDYNDYIEEQERLSRLSYISTCSAAQANVSMSANEQEYHYTLYYYDQADNLVRTIPPEGVRLLPADQFSKVDDIRNGISGSCNYSGPVVDADPAVADLTFFTTLSTVPTASLEVWLYNPSVNNTRLALVSASNTYLLQIGSSGSTMSVSVYSGYSGGVYYALNTTTVDLTGIRIYPWTHVVVQSSSFTMGILQVYVNGYPLRVIASGMSAVSYPVPTQNLSMLKHLRIYNRFLAAPEIEANATNTCLMPLNTDAAWYRFNVPDSGSETTLGNGDQKSVITGIYPKHTLRTTYVYNSTNQVTRQQSPDGGTNRFWYDLLSRLAVSQNDKQQPDSDYSYTRYDAIGRITEVGQKHGATGTSALYHYIGTNPDYVDTTSVNNFLIAGTNSQITHTYYDSKPTATGGIHALTQNNLRKRVAVSTYKENQADTVEHATYYNYDIDGNVKTLYQQVAGLGIKQIDYEYDLISGKVNFVRYQDGHPDQFYYQYEYDADNRLTEAWSGIGAIVDLNNGSELLKEYRKLDAHYRYYLHGPLARLELGDECAKVQGIDYAYTLQGWLKGVNSTNLNANTEMGQDGRSGTNNNNVAKDAYGFALHYYSNADYKPIGSTTTNPFADATTAGNYKALYNGNIAAQTVNIKQLGQPMLYVYGYDQLNRIKRANAFTGLDTTSNTWTPIATSNYKENFTYDGNGNILKANRNGNAGTMDSLSYQYTRDAHGHLANNKLNYVTDAASDGAYSTDIKNQSTGNYNYDAIGNLIQDNQAGISNIDWSVYGKIKTITKSSGNITYSYNPSGQRVTKTAGTTTTYYVRDAQGNTLALYDNAGNTNNWKEQDLYGSSRLGMWTPNINLATGNAQTVWDTVGRKFFELTNHLGNVLETITDRRLQVASSSVVDHFEADIASAQSYYAFGMQMPGMSYNSNYRYGFNGQEKSTEIDPYGNLNTAEFWEYDTRLGRRWNIDPVVKSWESGYAAFADSPVAIADQNGDVGKPADCPMCNPNVGAEVEIHDVRKPKPRRDNTSIKKPPIAKNYVVVNNKIFVPPPTSELKPAKLNGFAYADQDKSTAGQFYYNLVDQPYVTFNNLFNPFYDKTHLGGRMLNGDESVDAFVTTSPILLGLEIKASLPVVEEDVFTKSTLKLGQQMHREYKLGEAGIKEFRLPSGRRIDFLDINNSTIYELKPFNPNAMRAGQNQLNIYKQELETMPQFKGINWKTVLDTY